MTTIIHHFKCTVAAFLATVMFSLPLAAQDTTLDRLFDELLEATPESYERIEQQIWTEWSQSGSPAADLLLRRGRQAMETGDLPQAIAHFTALTDYAPDFAEGWNARATAYYQANLFGPSIDDIGRTLTLNPRHFGALSGLGLILEELGYSQSALDAWRKVKAINPARPNVDQAIERLEKAIGGQDL